MLLCRPSISISTLRSSTVVCCVLCICKTQTTNIVNQSPFYWHLKQMTSVLLASILCGSSQWDETRARICRPFKEPRNRLPASRVGKKPYYWPTRLHRLAESIPWLHNCLQIRAQWSQRPKAVETGPFGGPVQLSLRSLAWPRCDLSTLPAMAGAAQLRASAIPAAAY